MSILKVLVASVSNMLSPLVFTTPDFPFARPFAVTTAGPGDSVLVDLSEHITLEEGTELQAIEVLSYGPTFTLVTASTGDGDGGATSELNIEVSGSAPPGQLDTIRYRVQDDEGRWSLPATITVILVGDAVAPVVADATFVLGPGATLPVNFGPLITLGTSPVVQIQVTSPSPDVIVVLTGATTADAFAQPAFSGEASVTFVAIDGNGLSSNDGTITFTVNNVAPVAVPKTISLQALANRLVNPFQGASDANGNLGSPAGANVEIVSAPTKGTAVITAGGMITYTAGGVAGADSFTFRIRDQAGAWSSAVSVTVTITALNRAPTTSAGSATVQTDQSVDINLAALATDPDGDTLTYSVTTAPTKGTVALVGAGSATARYTPSGSQTEDTTDSFVFRATDTGGLWSASTITLNLLIPPDEPGDPPGAEIGTALRTINADNPAELATILATASGNFPAEISITGSTDRGAPYRPGDMIVLGNGAYGSRTFSRSGSNAYPIWIKAKNKFGVTVNSTWTLSGDNIRVWGVDFDGKTVGIKMQGDKSRAYRCKFHGVWTDPALQANPAKDGGTIVVSYTGADCGVLYCEFYDIDGRGFSGKSDILRPFVYRCYFHNFRNPRSGSGGNGREGVQFGQTQGTDGQGNQVRRNQGGRLISNLFVDMYNSSPGAGERAHDENEPFSNKSAGNEVRGNSVIRSKNLNGRFSHNCIFAQNYIGAGSQLVIYGDNVKVLANNATNGNYIAVQAGTQYMDPGKTLDNAGFSEAWDNGQDYPACRDTYVAGNSGELRIGEVPSHDETTASAKRTVIEGHTGTIKTQQNYGAWATPQGSYRETGATYSATNGTALARPTAALSLSEVGPDAPWIEMPATLLP